MSHDGAGRSRWARWAVVVSAVVTVAPLWCAHHLPFADMPQQIAVIAMLRHWWDPAWRLHEQYVLAPADSQYFLYHLVGALVTVVVGSAELANRVLLTCVGLGFPFAMRALLRALGRDARLALFAAPLFWSGPLLMGFMPYVAAAPLVAAGLALAVRQAREASRARAVGLAALATALFYVHVSAFALFAVTAVTLSFALRVEGASARERVASVAREAQGLWWMTPSLVAAAAWAARGSLAPRVLPLAGVEHVKYIRPASLAAALPIWAHDVWRSHVDELCAIAFWLAFAAIVVLRGSAPGDRRLARAAWVPFVCAVASYAALPFYVGVGTMLNTRIALFVALFAPLVLAPRAGRAGTVPLALVLVATIVGAANAALEVRRAEQDELGDIDRLIDRVPAHARLLTLPFRSASAHTHWPPWTFVGSYHLARRGGVAAMSFTELVHWPIHDRPGMAPPPKPPFWTLAPCLFRNGVDGAYFDYVLVRGDVDPFRDAPPGPRWRRIDAERDWVLFEKVQGAESPPWSAQDDGPCAPGPISREPSPPPDAPRPPP